MAKKTTQNKNALRVRAKMVEKELNGSAIGRSLNPPVGRSAVNQAIYGHTSYLRIREAIAEALGEPVAELWPTTSTYKNALKIRAKMVIKKISNISIAKSLIPPVSAPAVSQVIYSQSVNVRIREAIAEALDEPVSELWPEPANQEDAA